MIDMPNFSQSGKIRTVEVWIGTSKSAATFLPPPPGEVEEKLHILLTNWSEHYEALLKLQDKNKVAAITRFHHGIVSIHPFLDGNGRLARLLLSMQAAELLDTTKQIALEDRRVYFDALRKADHGDLSSLESEITQAIYGVEFVGGSPCQMSGQECPSCKIGILDTVDRDSAVECSECGFFLTEGN